jgi:hypothetical protein
MSQRKSPRPSTTARGYGTPHQALRRRFAELVKGGRVTCARCGGPIHPEEAWDLGHVDGDRTRWAGPEHRRCNRATSSRRKREQPALVPPDDPERGIYYGPGGRVWSRPWFEWRR